ncbi:MAG: hypothetical protein ACRYG5_16870 [Janthinobacterium lividum]
MSPKIFYEMKEQSERTTAPTPAKNLPQATLRHKRIINSLCNLVILLQIGG